MLHAAVALREMLDERMDVRAQMIRNNTNLLKELDSKNLLLFSPLYHT